jgi:hypothetical protein
MPEDRWRGGEGRRRWSSGREARRLAGTAPRADPADTGEDRAGAEFPPPGRPDCAGHEAAPSLVIRGARRAKAEPKGPAHRPSIPSRLGFPAVGIGGLIELRINRNQSRRLGTIPISAPEKLDSFHAREPGSRHTPQGKAFRMKRGNSINARGGRSDPEPGSRVERGRSEMLPRRRLGGNRHQGKHRSAQGSLTLKLIHALPQSVRPAPLVQQHA